LAVAWFEVNPYPVPGGGWRRAIGRVQSDWNPNEHFFDAWPPIAADLILGLPFILEPYIRLSTFFVTATVVIQSRSILAGSAIRYDGLSEKFKYGEACLEEDGVRCGVAYLNFARQYLCSTRFFAPNVVRAGFPDDIPPVPTEAENIIYGTQSNSSDAAGIEDYGIFAGIRMRGYDYVETRTIVYYRAGQTLAYKRPAAPIPIVVFSP